MGERYLYNQTGVVEEMCSFVKAVLGFTVYGRQHRVVMWVKNFLHEGELLDHTDSLHGKLKVGDAVTFHCHPYDKEENKDNCGWFAARAWRSQDNDDQLTVVNQQGRVQDLETGKGVLEFEFFDRFETVCFIRSKFFSFGHRVTSKHPLSNFLNEDDMVQFDAMRCQLSVENKHCNWFARIVWKGKKPASHGISYSETGGGHVTHSTVVSEETNEEEDEEEGTAPSVGATFKSARDNLYKRYEAGGTPRDGPGRVVSLLSEEAGAALWMTAPNCWETVFFHRTNAFIDDMCLNKYNLQESYRQETLLHITAVPAVSDFPCKWIARKVVATS